MPRRGTALLVVLGLALSLAVAAVSASASTGGGHHGSGSGLVAFASTGSKLRAPFVAAARADAKTKAMPLKIPAGSKGAISVCEPVVTRHARCMAELSVPTASGPPVPSLAFTPQNLAAIYNSAALVPADSNKAVIGIVDAYGYPHAEQDLRTYRSAFGLSECTTDNGCFTKFDQRGGTSYPSANGGWAQETALDLAAVSAICQTCRIVLVEADSNSTDDMAAAVAQAVHQGALYVSNS